MKKLKQIWDKTLNEIIKAVFPPDLKCIVCGSEMSKSTEEMVCEQCLKKLPFIKQCCAKCGEALVAEEGYCLRCQNQNEKRKYNFARSTFVFENEIVKLVHNLKYNEEKWLAKYLGKFMSKTFLENDMKADFLVPVPITKKKLKERGYNQAVLLAETMSKILDIPVLECVEKLKETKSQTGFSSKERLENVKDSFGVKIEVNDKIKNKKIVIVDDVYTTGATISAMCDALLKAHIKSENIFILTLAHTLISKTKKE